MKHFKSVIAMLLALVMILSCVGTAFAAEEKDLSKKTVATDIAKTEKSEKGESLKGFKSQEFKEMNSYKYADDEIVRAIVILEGETEADMGEVGSTKAANQRVKLVNQHNTVFRAMAGIDYTLKFEYTRLLNGFSCDVAYGDLEAIAAIDGVASVHIANSYADPVLEADKDTKQENANYIMDNSWMQENYWDGYGIVVAVLDTGLNLEHEAFQDAAGWAEDYGKLTEEMVEAADTFVDGKYISGKVPFAYDYADDDNDVTDTNGHGTHVSGSAVGMACTVDADGESVNVTFAGAAPAAQLLSMKIFHDNQGGTTTDIYFYALEDAYTLGADVINMSIGAQNGFTYDDSLETEVFGNIYERLSDAGVILSVAAGNEYSMAYYASSYAGYTGYVGPEYTDYGTVANPSTYEGNVSVASLENTSYPDYAVNIDGYDLPFNDSCEDGVHGWVATLGGTEHEYRVVLDSEGYFSLGTAEDFAANDVAGKIAIVSRGEIDFEAKVENAANAGAIGCIVVNNEPGIILMAIETFEIPAISMQQSVLEYLYITGTLYTNEDIVNALNPSGGLMSDFSNWGTSPTLTLDPTITAIGGMVYSSVPGGTDTYEVYSGTSMAAPNMSGTYANMLSALYEIRPDLSKAEAAELAKTLLYGATYLVSDAEGYLYSPRKQGTGLATPYYAIMNYMYSGYITNPIQELGDDAEKTGVYEMSLELQNDSEYELYYTNFETYVLYDYLYTDSYGDVINTLTSDYAYSPENETNYATVTYSVDGVEVEEFCVASGESVTIDVTITLDDEIKEYFDGAFPNGNFVEGYVMFNEYYEDEDGWNWGSETHATFLAYYGDWTDGSVLEEADWRDIVEADLWLNTTAADEDGYTYADYGYTWYNSGILDFYTNPNIAYITDAAVTSAVGYAGDNLLEYVPFYDEHISFSTPMTDGTYNYAEAIYMEPYQLRNAEHLIMTVSNAETGEVYYVDDTEYLSKAVFDYDYGAWYNTGVFYWDGTDAEGNYVPSGTVATITYDAVLPYGQTLKEDIWGFDVTVDYTAPVLESIVLDKEAGTLTVTASDENYLQGIYLADESYNILDAVTFSSDVKGESFTATFDISELQNYYGQVYVTALDYATNEMEELAEIIEMGVDATITLVTPTGKETVAAKTGDTFTFGAPEAEVENAEFYFWTTEPVERVNDEELWDAGGMWYFEGDSVMVTGDATFYALYGVGEYVPFDLPDYYYYQANDYSGDWAICGWDYDYDNDYYVTEDPAALNGDGEKIYVADLEDAVIGDYYTEFFTASDDIRFTFTKVGEDTYTIRNAASGKYLALADGKIAMADAVSDAAKWNVTSSPDNGSLVYNVAQPEMILLYEDELGEFVIMDDSQPLDWALEYYGMEIYPSEYYMLPLYTCALGEVVVGYYTTELSVFNTSGNCYFDDFSDCKDEWYHEAVDYSVANGLMNGVGNGKFDPNGTMTRAMIVTVLYRAAGSPEVAEPCTFTDVEAGQWYSDAIAWAEDNGVVNGVGEGKFAPMANVTREQIATILWRYSGSPEVEASLDAFADGASVSAYAQDAILWAVAEGIMQGDGKNLTPTANATRAQFACMIMRYLDGSYTCE